ncbi:MAG: SAM-dependent methyltransferase, partial [Deltaproteobacteria bacterium]|nr:SAM-dependent methyltransferase [Deltaproteobacteria bacterium]
LLQQYDPDFINKSKSFDTFDLPLEGSPRPYRDLFAEHGVAFMKGKKRLALVETKLPAQDSLVILVANSGVRGLVRIPHEEDECKRIFNKFENFIKKRENFIWEMIEHRTADEDMQEKIYGSLMSLLSKR